MKDPPRFIVLWPGCLWLHGEGYGKVCGGGNTGDRDDKSDVYVCRL